MSTWREDALQASMSCILLHLRPIVYLNVFLTCGLGGLTAAQLTYFHTYIHTYTHTHSLDYMYVCVRAHAAALVYQGYVARCALALLFFKVMRRADRSATILSIRCTAQRSSAYVFRSRHSLPAYVSIRQHTSAYGSIRQHTAAYVSIRQHTSACVSIRQHTSAYVSIRQHTSAYVSIPVVQQPLH